MPKPNVMIFFDASHSNVDEIREAFSAWLVKEGLDRFQIFCGNECKIPIKFDTGQLDRIRISDDYEVENA